MRDEGEEREMEWLENNSNIEINRQTYRVVQTRVTVYVL